LSKKLLYKQVVKLVVRVRLAVCCTTSTCGEFFVAYFLYSYLCD